MNFEKIILCILTSFVQSFASTYVIIKQTKNEKLKSISNNIKFFLLMWLYCIIVFLFITNQLRFLLCIIITCVMMYFVLKIKDKKVILYSFNTVILMSVAEIISSLMLVFLGVSSIEIVNNPKYNLIVNIIISVITIIMANLPITKFLYKKIINLFNKRKGLINYLYVFLLVLYLIVSKNGLEFILKSNYYVNVLFVIAIVIIFLIIIKNEDKYEQLKQENKQMYTHVTKYEKIITEQGKANHEFKNQLMVIRGYAQMNSSKLIDYIDSITKDASKTQSSYLISQLNKFPEGGIKGLLYYKLSVMEEEKIKYELDVETGVKTKLNVLSVNMYKNITKILGVLIDNAIEASKKSKKKIILISVTKDKSSVIFNISNSYSGKIDLSKLGSGYTSKGFGHGYGLRLVNDILNETNSFIVKNDIVNGYFVSELTVKIRRKKKK